MAYTTTKLGSGEYTIGSATGGGLKTNLGNIYYAPSSPATQQQASTYNVPYAPQPTSGGGGGAPQPIQQQSSGPSPEEQARIDAENRVRSDIESGFGSYFSELDNMLGGLSGQQQGQEQIVNNNYSQGLTDINAQKASSLGDLGTQRRKNEEGQVRTLQDLSENIRNIMRAGGVRLGAMGAGDSSAANQYSYAVGKLGAKERGNVLNQSRSIQSDIDDREAKLNNIVTQELGKLKTNRDNKILEVAQWFQDKQQQLQMMKAQGQLQKGQSLAQLSMSLLQEAQSRLMQADADAKNQQQMLSQWALNHATTIQQAKSAIGQQGNYQAAPLTANKISALPTYDAGGRVSAATGYGGYSNEDELKNPFA